MKYEIRKRGTPAAQTRGRDKPHPDAVFVPLKSSPNGGGRWEIDTARTVLEGLVNTEELR